MSNSTVKAGMTSPHAALSSTCASTMEGTTLPTEIQQHLGNLLKASYNDVLTAPIPDRFMQLLEQLEQTNLSHTNHTTKEFSDDR